jgi:hypothetical protein
MLTLLSSSALAGGPKSTYPTPPGLDSEMQNIYHDIANPVINIGVASTMTITYLPGYAALASTQTFTGTNTFSSATITNLAVSSVTAQPLNGSPFHIEVCAKASTFTITATTATTITSGFVATSLSGTITPHSVASYIKLWESGEIQNSGAGNTVSLTFLRNGVNIENLTGGVQAAPMGSSAYRIPTNMVYIDSPATTSAITYAVGMSPSAGTATFCANNETCVLIIQECIQL